VLEIDERSHFQIKFLMRSFNDQFCSERFSKFLNVLKVNLEEKLEEKQKEDRKKTELKSCR
jgi:hypothetical protein